MSGLLTAGQPPQAEALSSLSFYADLRSDDEIDLEDASEQLFINPAGNTLPVAQPLMKAAVMALSTAYPDALSYSDLLTAARHVMAEFGAVGNIGEAAFRDALFQLVMAHGVMSSVSAESHAGEPGERPSAHALARLQARSPGWVVSGTRHVAMDLDAPARQLLDLLDGSRTIDELTTLMQAALAQAGMEKSHETISELTHQQLWLFARQGLLTQ